MGLISASTVVDLTDRTKCHGKNHTPACHEAAAIVGRLFRDLELREAGEPALRSRGIGGAQMLIEALHDAQGGRFGCSLIPICSDEVERLSQWAHKTRLKLLQGVF